MSITHISLEQDSSYYIPKPLQYGSIRNKGSDNSLPSAQSHTSHPFLPCKSEPVLTRCGHSTVSPRALSETCLTCSFCLRLYTGFGMNIQGCSAPPVTVTLHRSSRINSSTYHQTMNFWSPNQMEYSKADNVCLLMENDFSHLNIRASPFHHLL